MKAYETDTETDRSRMRTRISVIEKKLTSQYFNNERTIKISLPTDFDNTKKYPVIYTLDGFGLFEITSSYSKFLMDYDVIPKAIVVSIFHNNRNYETSPNYGQNINIPKGNVYVLIYQMSKCQCF